MGNRLNCGCCGGCDITDLAPSDDWSDWTDPPANPPTLAAGESPSRTLTVDSEDWTVDIAVSDWFGDNDAYLYVGDVSVRLRRIGSFRRFDITGLDCQNFTPTFDPDLLTYWFRFQESEVMISGDPKRRSVLEIWTGDPSIDGSSKVFDSCNNREPSPDRDYTQLFIEITAAPDRTLAIGSIRFSSTSETNSDCPTITACTPRSCVESTDTPRLYMVTGATIALSSFTDDTLTSQHDGRVQRGSRVEGPISLTSSLTVEFSFLNGTYLYVLHRGGTPQTPAQTTALIERVKSQGICGTEASLYSWRSPWVTLSNSWSETLSTPDLGYSFFDSSNGGFTGASPPYLGTFSGNIDYTNNPVFLDVGASLLRFQSSSQSALLHWTGNVTSYRLNPLLETQLYLPSNLSVIPFATCVPPVSASDNPTAPPVSRVHTYEAGNGAGTITRTWSASGYIASRVQDIAYVEL